MGSPRIAVLLGREREDSHSLHRGYAEAVFAAGALPILVVPGPAGFDDELLALVASCDAVLLTGGDDVGPERYGEADRGLVRGVDPDRDRLEIAVVAQAVARGQRVLGICRGAQLLNVALGGSLHQDLPEAGFHGHTADDRPAEPVHELTAEPGTLAARLLAGTPKVNTLHHQAVKDLGQGLRASAWSADGVIEAIEGERLLGVQWHPERLVEFDLAFHTPFLWLAGALP